MGVRQFVCLSHLSTASAPCGRFAAWATHGQEILIDSGGCQAAMVPLHHSVQQHAVSSRCVQRHVYSYHRALITDLHCFEFQRVTTRMSLMILFFLKAPKSSSFLFFLKSPKSSSCQQPTVTGKVYWCLLFIVSLFCTIIICCLELVRLGSCTADVLTHLIVHCVS